MQALTLRADPILTFAVATYPFNVPAFVGWPAPQDGYVSPPGPELVTILAVTAVNVEEFSQVEIQFSVPVNGFNPFLGTNPWVATYNGVDQTPAGYGGQGTDTVSFQFLNPITLPVIVTIPSGYHPFADADGNQVTPGVYPAS